MMRGGLTNRIEDSVNVESWVDEDGSVEYFIPEVTASSSSPIGVPRWVWEYSLWWECDVFGDVTGVVARRCLRVEMVHKRLAMEE